MSSRCLRLGKYSFCCGLAAATCSFILLGACQREKRELRPQPVRMAIFGNAAAQSDLHPGSSKPPSSTANPYHDEAYAISEGQRLFSWYNCTGCHANGGGGIGPPLIKSEWIYGVEPANLFDTIVQGRPNGMPTWGKKIPEYQVWQLVAYIRSLNDLESSSAKSSRADTISQKPTPGAR